MEESFGADLMSNAFSSVVDSVMGLPEVGSGVFSKVRCDGLDPVSTGPDLLAPQPSPVVMLVPDSVKLKWSSLATVSSVIGSVTFGASHSGGVSLGGKEDSRMDVIPALDMVHRPQSMKTPEVLPIIQSFPSSPVVDGLAPKLDEIHKSPFVKNT
jgi:hypothetical protein